MVGDGSPVPKPADYGFAINNVNIQHGTAGTGNPSPTNYSLAESRGNKCRGGAKQRRAGEDKQKRQVFRPVLIIALSDSALNLVGTEASGTCVHMARSPVNDSLDPLHIGLPSTVGPSVGVGNLDTEGHALTAKITLSHSLHLLSA